MTTTTSPSPADDLAQRATALVAGWRNRPVTREAWHAADDLIMEMYPYDEERATAAHRKLCESYEQWLATQPVAADAAPTIRQASLLDL